VLDLVERGRSPLGIGGDHGTLRVLSILPEPLDGVESRGHAGAGDADSSH
jgi:hypothetical protein